MWDGDLETRGNHLLDVRCVGTAIVAALGTIRKTVRVTKFRGRAATQQPDPAESPISGSKASGGNVGAEHSYAWKWFRGGFQCNQPFRYQLCDKVGLPPTV
jgi:hypothetical protein